MFAGGLVSRNLARRASRRRISPESRENERRRSDFLRGKRLLRKAKSPLLINWCEPNEAGKNISTANKRPFYVLEVPGRFRLLTIGGAVVVIGAMVTCLGFLLTWMKLTRFCGPIGIGIGIYVDLMAITWILEEREADKKLYHIQDLYTPFATVGARKSEDKAKDHTNPHSNSTHKRKAASPAVVERHQHKLTGQNDTYLLRILSSSSGLDSSQSESESEYDNDFASSDGEENAVERICANARSTS